LASIANNGNYFKTIRNGRRCLLIFPDPSANIFGASNTGQITMKKSEAEAMVAAATTMVAKECIKA
jgi:hypothetical protein